MRLRNPPIVEAWIEFHFRGSDSESTWPQGLDRFFEEIRADYPNIELKRRETFQVVQRAPGGVPVQLAVHGEIDRVRAFDAQRRWCVQVGDDALVVNLIKGTGTYEGFEALLPKALLHLGQYAGVFRPQSVLHAALHYTDVVVIPASEGVSRRLEDYFHIGVRVPDEQTWPLGKIALDVSVPLTGVGEELDHLVLGFRREPPRPGCDEDRFRMDWHAVCVGLDTMASDVLRGRLQGVHDAMKERFRACFTPRTWEMFGEEREA